MSVNERLAETRRWLRWALEDLGDAEEKIASRKYVPRHACFQAQQASEKALKTVLIYLQIPYPRTHDLDALRNLIPDDWSVKLACPDLEWLSEWAVESRYPGERVEATRDDARQAVRQARAIWDIVSKDLLARGFSAE